MKTNILSPKYIHQIFISESNEEPSFPISIEENIRSLKVFYPQANYKLWNLSEIDQFIKENFSPDVLESFRLLKPYAYKADLARLCLLYHFGGLYVDLGIRLIQAIEVPINFGILAFRDLQNDKSMWNSVSNGIIWTQEPFRKEIKRYIDSIVENCQKKFYGLNPLYPTGPVLFGKCITKTMVDNNHIEPYEFWIGEIQNFTRDPHTIFFMTSANQLFGFRIKSISHSEISTDLKLNQYNEMWYTKTIYGEEYYYFSAYSKDVYICPEAKTTPQGIAPINNSELTMLCYGPYIFLEKGHYYFEIFGRNSLGTLEIEIAAELGRVIVTKQSISLKKEENSAGFKFVLDKDFNDIEFRIYSAADFEGGILGYRLDKSDNELISS